MAPQLVEKATLSKPLSSRARTGPCTSGSAANARRSSLIAPYQRYGIDAMMDRLKERTGFRVHAHAFRHAFATMATKLGWNFEHLRAAMGHSDYKVLQRYSDSPWSGTWVPDASGQSSSSRTRRLGRCIGRLKTYCRRLNSEMAVALEV